MTKTAQKLIVVITTVTGNNYDCAVIYHRIHGRVCCEPMNVQKLNVVVMAGYAVYQRPFRNIMRMRMTRNMRMMIQKVALKWLIMIYVIAKPLRQNKFIMPIS